MFIVLIIDAALPAQGQDQAPVLRNAAIVGETDFRVRTMTLTDRQLREIVVTFDAPDIVSAAGSSLAVVIGDPQGQRRRARFVTRADGTATTVLEAWHDGSWTIEAPGAGRRLPDGSVLVSLPKAPEVPDPLLWVTLGNPGGPPDRVASPLYLFDDLQRDEVGLVGVAPRSWDAARDRSQRIDQRVTMTLDARAIRLVFDGKTPARVGDQPVRAVIDDISLRPPGNDGTRPAFSVLLDERDGSLTVRNNLAGAAGAAGTTVPFQRPLGRVGEGSTVEIPRVELEQATGLRLDQGVRLAITRRMKVGAGPDATFVSVDTGTAKVSVARSAGSLPPGTTAPNATSTPMSRRTKVLFGVLFVGGAGLIGFLLWNWYRNTDLSLRRTHERNDRRSRPS